ncbi:unnamed protein product [Merluccius merluccius]
MELLEEDLTCPICCGLFDDPRVLLCSHSFCKRCLEGMLEGNRGGGGLAATAWRPFKCPTCRKETPHNGAHGLQVNYTLRGIVEKYNRIRVLPRMSACREHDGQPLNIFCATDLKLICGFCATTGDHKGHAFCALDEAYRQERAAFERLSRDAENWRSVDLLARLETLEAGKKKALQSVSRDAEKVTGYFNALVAALEHKKSEILSDFETLKLAAMQAYDPEINRLNGALDQQSRARSIAESFWGDDASASASDPESDPLRFLQQMQEFREKLRVVREASLPLRTDIIVDHHVRHFDVRSWDALRLRDVDKISVPHAHGSAETTSRLRVPHRHKTKAFFVLMSVLLPAVFLLHPDTLTATSAHVEAFLGALSPHFREAELYWRRGVAACACVLGAGHLYALDLLDTAVGFIGG